MSKSRRTMSLASAALVLAAGSLSAQQPRGRVFPDPGGRYTVTVPPGWEPGTKSGAVTVVRGRAVAVFMAIHEAKSAGEIVEASHQDHETRWRNLAPVNHGSFTLAGVPAEYAMYSGLDESGIPSLLRVVGLIGRSDGYLVLIRAPQADFNSVREALQSIEESLSIGGMPGPANGPYAGNPGGGAGGGVMGLGNGPAGPPPAGRGDRADRAVLGVSTRDLATADAQQLGLKDARGALIAQIQPGSAADRAGLQPGDVVVSVDRHAIEHSEELQRAVAGHHAGDRMDLVVIRRGKQESIRVQFQRN